MLNFKHMCGIAGYFGPNGSEEKLKIMAEAIKHRGPDDSGFFVEDEVGLGFQRLSIIDLKSGHQPMTNNEKNLWIIFNGEIYDYKNTRSVLEKLGHKFLTNSDTEVILKSYEEWGEDCFEKLNGMFAVAIWDKKKAKLILSRDRMGKKPLYWTLNNNTIWFASELKAFLNAEVITKEIDLDSVALFFRTDYVPTPKTIFKEVFKLEPATTLAIDKNKNITKKVFWEYPIENIPETSDEQIIKELGYRIDKAVKDRLVSDVPLGLFLSGGLDSAVIAESASRQNPGLQAFTIGFEESTYDETNSAKIIAEKFGLKHHIETLSENNVLSVLNEAISMMDEPLADPSILPQILLSKFTKKNVTVTLSGDGGDELLLGYQHIPAHIWREKFNFVPTYFFNKIADVLGKIKSNSNYFSFGFKAQRLSRGLSMSDRYERDLAWRGSFDRKGLKRLLKPETVSKINLNQPVEIMRKYADQSPSQDSWSAWSFSYLRTFLMDDVMVKVDRATMWSSIESRAPLLDKNVVSYLLNLPDKFKLGNFKNKRLFKEILKNKLPDEILNNPKHGFGVPTAKWLNSSLSKRIEEVTDKKFLEDQNIFNREYILKIIEEHKTGKRDKRKELWSYLIFQLWYIKWFKNIK